MSDPVAFISHFRIKEGAADAVRRMSVEVPRRLEAEKPRTAVFLSFIDEEEREVSFVHVFGDSDAMVTAFELTVPGIRTKAPPPTDW